MMHMSSQRNIVSIVFAVIATLVCLLFIGVKTAAAQVNGTVNPNPQQTTKQPAQTEIYKYSAQPGDSYSLMSRKAIQTYGKVQKVKLSHAEIIAAETFLTKELGSGHLNINQPVNLQVSQVKKSIERAQKLSAPQKAAWQTYVQFANFNTDSVGQPR